MTGEQLQNPNDRQCDEHEDRSATIVYDDDSAWCEECHVANLDAGAAAGWSP